MGIPWGSVTGWEGSALAMGAGAGELDELGTGRETFPGGERAERHAQVVGGGLVHAAALVADHEHDDVTGAVLGRAGDEGIAALEPMHEASLLKKVEGTIHGDGCQRPPVLRAELVDELIGADRAMRRVQRLQHLPADGRESKVLDPAGLLRLAQGARSPLAAVMQMRAAAILEILIGAITGVLLAGLASVIVAGVDSAGVMPGPRQPRHACGRLRHVEHPPGSVSPLH